MSGETAEVRLGELALPLPARGAKAGPAKIAVRPESLVLSAERSARSIEGRLAKAAYLGTHMEYTVAFAGGDRFVVDKNVTSPFKVGSTLWVSLADHGVTLIPPT